MGIHSRTVVDGIEDIDAEAFFQGYVDCAIWASTAPDGQSLDTLMYGSDDITAESLDSMRADCNDFVEANAVDLSGFDAARAGHDFWLTRNRHGAGFWDGDYPQEIGARLTAAAHAYGSSDLYVGDDGFVHVSPI